MRKQSPGGWKHCKVHGRPKDVSCYPATMDCCHGIAMEFRTRFGRYSSVGEKDRNSYFKVKSLNFWMLVLTTTQKISCELKQVRTFLLTKWSEKKKKNYILDLGLASPNFIQISKGQTQLSDWTTSFPQRP